MRNFSLVKNAPSNVKLPVRGTKNSAGYDFYAPCDIFIPAKGISDNIPLYVKSYMDDDDFLQLKIRSSLAVKHGIILCTSGVIDSDYVDNEDNEGNICVKFANLSDEDFTIKSGERCCQGIFLKYATVKDDNFLNSTRKGGHGSTDSDLNENLSKVFEKLVTSINADYSSKEEATAFYNHYKYSWEVNTNSLTFKDKYKIMKKIVEFLNEDFNKNYSVNELPPFVVKPSFFFFKCSEYADRYFVAFGYKKFYIQLNELGASLSDIPIVYLVNKHTVLKRWNSLILSIR